MSELKQRKTGPSSDTGDKTEVFLEAIIDKTPDSIKPYLTKLVPILVTIANLIAVSIPIILDAVSKLKVILKDLEPYRLNLLIPSLIGFILCFFGGSFLTIIAAVEAYRLCGYESSIKCIMYLYEDLQVFIAANNEDDRKDADGSGIADVDEMNHQQLITRKTMLFLKTVDPQRFTNALAGLNAGFLAVVATLKLEFAKAITLGSAIADCIDKPATQFVLPYIVSAIPADVKHWARPVMSYSIHAFAISLSWFIQRVISAFHSAIRGGLMCSRNILEYLSEMNILHIDHEKTQLDEVLGYGLAILGFLFQISRGFTLPFPLNVLLFPFTVLEWFLVAAVTK